jgi:ribosome-associated protein
MRTAIEGRPDGASQRDVLADKASSKSLSKSLCDSILNWLDEAKAEDVVTIDLEGKSTLADFMIVATGRSDRHVGAIGEQVQRKLKDSGHGRARAEGMDQCDWVLVDAGNVIVHVFRPEVRDFYKLERMWSGERPADGQSH